MNQTTEQAQLERVYRHISEELSEDFLALLLGSPFNRDGVHYYGESRYVTKQQFEKLLTQVHPRHLEQTVHFVFFQNRWQFIRKLFSKYYGCRQDIGALFNGNPNALFACENHGDAFVYFYDFNQEKDWEQAAIVVAILSVLYQKSHPEMTEQKRKKKRELYVYRMLNRLLQKV